jgi:hypothetical protein
MSNNPEDDDGLFDENNDDSSDEEVVAKKPSKKRKATSTGPEKKKPKPQQSWIDDAAEESGDEGNDDDEEDDDDENENDYIEDDFVVGEDEVEFKKKTTSGDLEDSDDDDNDDGDGEGDDNDETRKLTKKKRVKKKKSNLELAEEDLDLIAEARGDTDREAAIREREEAARNRVFGRDQDELHKGLFNDSEDDADAPADARPKPPKRRMVEQYDEDGMDDFIDDDLNDQQQIRAASRTDAYDEEGTGVSEAQFNEASEIFGTDYLEFMATDNQNMDDGDDDITGKYSERGVGVDLDSEVSSDDEEDEDDDLFGDDDGGDTVQASQKREALKLKREKRELARKERRKAKLQQKNSKRKAQLRRAFEPVQLMENFCTDQDDEIRRLDAPERFFDWKTPFHGSTDGGEITEEEEEEAMWIIGRIPEIASEYFSPSQNMEEMEEREKKTMSSIVHALRLLHVEKLEPIFIKRYREDVVTSPAVRENLYKIMDEDAEYDTMVSARTKVGAALENIMRGVETDEAAGAEAEFIQKLESDLAQAEEKLEEAAKQESEIKTEIDQIGATDDDAMDEDEDDDDDELFGDDDVSISCVGWML